MQVNKDTESKLHCEPKGVCKQRAVECSRTLLREIKVNERRDCRGPAPGDLIRNLALGRANSASTCSCHRQVSIQRD